LEEEAWRQAEKADALRKVTAEAETGEKAREAEKGEKNVEEVRKVEDTVLVEARLQWETDEKVWKAVEGEEETVREAGEEAVWMALMEEWKVEEEEEAARKAVEEAREPKSEVVRMAKVVRAAKVVRNKAAAARRKEVKKAMRNVVEKVVRNAVRDAKAVVEARRRWEALRNAGALSKADEEALQKTLVSIALAASAGEIPIYSPAQRLAEITSCGRDPFVAELLKNPHIYESTPDALRHRTPGDHDGIIYLLICLENLKLYIGQTKNFDVRMRDHRKGHKGTTGVLTKAIKKHGWYNFMSVILIRDIGPKEELDSIEIALIKHFDCLTSGKRGYNIILGGVGVGDISVETRSSIGDSNRGKTHIMSVEAREKIGAANSKAVVVTIIQTGEEVFFSSIDKAVAEMCTSRTTMNKLIDEILEELKCRGGKYAGQFFTARLSVEESAEEKEARSSISKVVVVTILQTGEEIFCPSISKAVKEMSTSRDTIYNLIGKRVAESICHRGKYANKLFTAARLHT